MNRLARIYIMSVVALGLLCLATANWEMQHGSRFAFYLIICILASAMKVTLPGILGTLSVSYVFILIGILDVSAGQTILMGCAGALVQCVWRPEDGFNPCGRYSAFRIWRLPSSGLTACITPPWFSGSAMRRPSLSS